MRTITRSNAPVKLLVLSGEFALAAIAEIFNAYARLQVWGGTPGYSAGTLDRSLNALSGLLTTSRPQDRASDFAYRYRPLDKSYVGMEMLR